MVNFLSSGLVNFLSLLSGLVVVLVLLVSLSVLLSSIAFGCESKLLSISDFVHERVGININFLLLVFLSFPTPLQHPHAVVLAP